MLNSERAAPSAGGGGANEHQRQVDAMLAQARAEAPVKRPSLFKPAPPRPDPSSDPLDLRIAEELECIRRHLDMLGGVLVGEPVLLHRYPRQLQSIDRINQLLGHLARVIGAKQKDMAVDQVTLQDLRGRLKRKPLATLNSPFR